MSKVDKPDLAERVQRSRKREVVAKHSTYYVCDVHGWDFTDVDGDVCPVCYGESLKQEQILALLKENRDKMANFKTDYAPSIGNMAIRVEVLDVMIKFIKAQGQ